MVNIGIDIGGTKIIFGLVTQDGKILARMKKKTIHVDNQQAFIQYLKTSIDELITQADIEHSEVNACGVGVPGTVAPDGTTILLAPNLGWTNVDIAQALRRALGLPVRVIQDSRAAAYGEYKAGAGRTYRMVVCITLGTGIGTGIVMDGEVLNGALNTAGELGHTPIVLDGRACDCGKKGCLECYVAGKGLTRTAKEMWGEHADSELLFSRASKGDEEAKSALETAVKELGKVIVSMFNLLSPDCLLFSGGLCAQRALFLDPLMQFIHDMRYCTQTQPPLYVGLAALGEDAAMVGAALLPAFTTNNSPQLSASLMCADWLHLQSELSALEQCGMDYVHYDVMDGHFVPNLMIPPEIINKLRAGTFLSFDIHIMAENPENVLEMLELQAGDRVTIHAESTNHVQRVLAQIKKLGAQAAVAINPATPIEVIRDILPDIDMVLVMTVNPGFAGQKMVPQSVQKIKRIHRMLEQEGYGHIRIAADGNCSPENIITFYEAGVDTFVLGSSSIFVDDTDICKAVKLIRKIFQG